MHVSQAMQKKTEVVQKYITCVIYIYVSPHSNFDATLMLYRNTEVGHHMCHISYVSYISMSVYTLSMSPIYFYF